MVILRFVFSNVILFRPTVFPIVLSVFLLCFLGALEIPVLRLILYVTGDAPPSQTAPKGLLGDRPAGWNGESESQSPPAPTPGVVDVGPANPLLATYLERQIKNHLSKLQPPKSKSNMPGKSPLLPGPDGQR